jgi:type IV pilus assembly protein PilY1
MKTTPFSRPRVSTWALSLAIGLYTAAGALSVHAATSFPDYPLQSGAGVVPPNIMFILDNSGSMADGNMAVPGATAILPVDLSIGTRGKNSLAYDPAVTYAPWDTDVNGTTTVVPGGTTYSAAYLDASTATTTGSIGGNTRSVFYVLRDANAPDVSTSYDRYRINPRGTVVKAAVSSTASEYDKPFGALQAYYYRDVSVTLPENAGAVTVRISPASGSAGGPAVLMATTNGTEPWTNNTICPVLVGANQHCNFEMLGNASEPTTLRIRIFAYQAGVGELRLRVDSVRLASESAALPNAGRTNAQETANIATWYSFHRTRMKVAKAGASRAFIGLGSGYRVGFDTINDDSGKTNTAIRYPVPVDSNSGRFEGANRTTWFSWLHDRVATGGTPLRSSLKRAGEYYKTDIPWTDGAGTAEQACRASYALLSTDGYWNLDEGFSIGGDIDKDGSSNTLADVAQYYWANDLRTTLENLVPTTSKDTADWQHMGTFGVSIGLQGTLPITTTPPTSWPNPTDREDAERIDDLWHASINGRGKFIVASQAQEYANALRGALDNIKEQVASGSNITANGNSLNNGAQIFQAMFTSRIWSGDVKAYDISQGGIATTPDWSLVDTVNNPANDFASRPVLTWHSGGGANFGLTTVPDSKVFARTSTAIVTAEDNIAYIKGVRSRELQNGGNLRDRRSPIGDIVNSSPFYQRELNALFIGANDGMLHGVDSVSGKVLFSYVPAGVDFTALASLSDPDYYHRFFVDGQIDVSTKVHGSGKNILASGLGRGGKGIFALDVSTANTTGGFSASNVLWDATGNADADMGYVLGQPLIRKGNNGSTLVITGNGIESANGKAIIYVYVLSSTGAVASIRKFDTGIAGGNGMSEPRAADIDGNGTVDTIYAGDLKGNLWKVDLSDSSPTKWGFALTSGGGSNGTPVPMFTARDENGVAQPITAAVALAREPGSGRIFVHFGTGKFISQSDIVTTSSVEQRQTVYGLIDSGTAITGRTELQARSIYKVGTDSLGRVARSFESYSVLPTGKRGWYLDLARNTDAYGRGERVVTAAVVRGRASYFSSIVPNLGEGCSNTGKGFLNAIDVFTGTNPDRTSFMDIDNNGRGDDKLAGEAKDGADGFVSSVDLGVAMPGQPAQIGEMIAVGGSNAKSASVRKAAGSDTPKRLSWRELINR